jgi:hypothetical protein
LGRSIIGLVGLVVILGIGYYIYLNRDKLPTGRAPRLTTTGPSKGGPSASGGCDPNLNKYMWQIPGTKRLQIISSCLTLTGKVGRTSSAPDGDYNFDLNLDPAYSKYRSTQGSHGSAVWCEVICQKPVRDSSAAEKSLDKYRHACPGCKCYKGRKFGYLPKTGDHVKVSGVYVKDIREGGHMEIHPVSSVTQI